MRSSVDWLLEHQRFFPRRFLNFTRACMCAVLVLSVLRGRVEAQRYVDDVTRQVMESVRAKVQDNAQEIASQRNELAQYRAQNFTSRVAVLESEMAEIKWMIRGLIAAMMGQIWISVFGDRRRDRHLPTHAR